LTDSHEASGFLRRLLEAGVDVRFADLPQIQGATGRFLLQMVAVAELEAGMISTRTKAALTAAKARGKILGGRRIRKSDGKPVVISRARPRKGAAANRKRATDRPRPERTAPPPCRPSPTP